MRRALFIEIITCLLVVLFTYAGLSKILDYQTFKYQLIQSPLLAPLASVISFSLSISELLISGLLIVPATRLSGCYLSMTLLILFTGYIIYMFLSFEHLPCSCGGLIRY